MYRTKSQKWSGKSHETLIQHRSRATCLRTLLRSRFGVFVLCLEQIKNCKEMLDLFMVDRYEWYKLTTRRPDNDMSSIENSLLNSGSHYI